VVGGQRAQVDRRLGVGEQDGQRLAGREVVDERAGADVGDRAPQAAHVELHSLIVMLAVILESGERDRLYTGLSLLVSTAAEGEEARALVSFGALPALAAGDVDPDLWATAQELGIPFHACAAAADPDPGPFPVMSMPRFLEETAGARLVVV
jgi:hypothetical protein